MLVDPSTGKAEIGGSWGLLEHSRPVRNLYLLPYRLKHPWSILLGVGGGLGLRLSSQKAVLSLTGAGKQVRAECVALLNR